ncbi:hypothetical protein PIB30_081523 [Stylosanthes scabra]|uniref:Uncharacterized protein n=1 Tax=Stylosanthes scabra TaxID=79078 RepID=A0ABU6STB1_9FABA|nr:hypothetical protein [Stylosanthes scabra]
MMMNKKEQFSLLQVKEIKLLMNQGPSYHSFEVLEPTVQKHNLVLHHEHNNDNNHHNGDDPVGMKSYSNY